MTRLNYLRTALLLPFLRFYSLIVGYGYVLFASAVYVLLLKAGAIKGESARFCLDELDSSIR
ncbi:MAG: hypothetical protein V4631_22430 [Pseudomonadota bacterium]